ncbi:MAG: DUF3696 domain-containing protein [Candidatus Schekmanbacteria bacterium]|nr:DUF3696 domain-containing protein [Candidatus Schekmanbacteria bacterium]
MVIRQLAAERYKTYADRTVVSCRPFTILVGKNNSGKSAIARSLPLIAGSLALSSHDRDIIPLSSHGIVHGIEFVDIITNRSAHGSVVLEIQIDDINLNASIQNFVRSGRVIRQQVTHWKLTGSGRFVELDSVGIDAPPGQFRVSTEAAVDAHVADDVRWDGLRPRLRVDALASSLEWVAARMDELAQWSAGLRYLASPRRPQALFATPGGTAEAVEGLAHDGANVGRILAADDQRRLAVREWFHESLEKVVLDVREQGPASFIEVRQGSDAGSVMLDQAGQGIAQVLPVVALALGRGSAGPGIDVIEHPEAELHPAAHAAVAELLLKSVRAPGRPLLIETHSEMILLRTRRWVAEGRLDPSDVIVYWIQQTDDGHASVRPISISRSGDLDGWPDGVFYEDYEEVLAIRRAARRGAGA